MSVPVPDAVYLAALAEALETTDDRRLRHALTRGACRNHDPEQWFSKEGRWPTRETLRICRQECPVAAECCLVALRDRERHGIWAGTTSRQRQRILELLAKFLGSTPAALPLGRRHVA